jgi:microcystin-dependent protein
MNVFIALFILMNVKIRSLRPYGGKGSIPIGWALCDGRNGSPDLRDKFVYGGDNNNNGVTGGLKRVRLEIEEIPKHAHDFLYKYRKFQYSNSEPGGEASEDVNSLIYYSGFDEPSKAFGKTKFTGGSKTHENMPPFYTLAYIIKL